MKDRSVECGLATYVQCEFRHPATKTQDPREVHDHDRNITGKDTNPFSEGRETQLYYGRGKTGVPGEKTVARASKSNLYGNSSQNYTYLIFQTVAEVKSM